MYNPALGKELDAVVAVGPAGSPVSAKVSSPSRSHSLFAIDPSGSEDVEVKTTGSPTFGFAGEYVKEAEGGRFGCGTTIVQLRRACATSREETVAVTRKVCPPPARPE